jgi:hypothetical protein
LLIQAWAKLRTKISRILSVHVFFIHLDRVDAVLGGHAIVSFQVLIGQGIEGFFGTPKMNFDTRNIFLELSIVAFGGVSTGMDSTGAMMSKFRSVVALVGVSKSHARPLHVGMIRL